MRGHLARSRERPPTVQAIYKELRGLQSRIVVFKSRDRYFLSLPWLLTSKAEFDAAVDTYSSQQVLTQFLPEPGSTQTWRFSDISSMDRFVVNLIVSLLRTGTSKTIYHWDPYPWYAVFHTDLAEPFLKEFARAGYEAYGVLGAASPISERVRDTQRRFKHQWWIGAPPFPSREDTAFSVKPPYLLSVKYPAKAIAVFRTLFSRKSLTPADLAPFHNLHFQKLSYTVKLTHAELKAQRLAGAFHTLFPPRLAR